MTFIISSDMHHPFQGYQGDTTNVPDKILNLMATKNADFSFVMGDQIVIEVLLNNLGRCCFRSRKPTTRWRTATCPRMGRSVTLPRTHRS